MTRAINKVERFYSLDAVRGIAALSIVLFHFRHFFYHGAQLGAYRTTELPLYGWLFPLYTRGDLAVDMFFCLSGFVFYWLYSQRIASRAISPGRFALLRFSRLYPLHLATLLAVALGQTWLLHKTGSYYVYECNDIRHFLLNLCFASSWGMEGGYSFNGPVWSVSVEVLLYALFFFCCRLFPIRITVLAGFSIGGFLALLNAYSPVWRGIGSFFLGGCVFLAYQAIIASRHAATLTKIAGYLTVAMWTATIYALATGRELSLPLLNFPVMVLFPLTILSLALIETWRGSLGRRVAFLGDISYSSYMLHFPCSS